MSDVEMGGARATDEPIPMERKDRRQILTLVGGPIVLLVGLQVKYAVAQQWDCRSVVGSLVNHVVACATLLAVLAIARVARREWRGAGREVPGDHDGSEGRTRTVAAIGFGLSVLTALVVLSQWLPQFVIDPCLE